MKRISMLVVLASTEGRRLPMKRAALMAITVGMVLLTIGVAPTWAQPTTTICVPQEAGTPVVSGTSEGTCTSPKYNALRLPGPEGLATLNKILPHLTYLENWIGDKPTIQISGVNVQIINGAGHTPTTNGAGNLIIGYDEFCNPEEVCPPSPGNPKKQTGSHNLVVGNLQNYASYGAIIGGFANHVLQPDAFVAGAENTINGPAIGGSVSGGADNIASAFFSSVSGGERNRAEADGSSVSGGFHNTIRFKTGILSSVSGGNGNIVKAPFSTVSGGLENMVTETAEGDAAILGGTANKATGFGSSLLGGSGNEAKGRFSSVSGGRINKAEGRFSSIFGGSGLTAKGEFEALPSCVAPGMAGELC
jgi:hypothetical protein